MAKTSKRPFNKIATIHDQKLERGEGGELHQLALGKSPILTTAQGGPVSDDQNSLKVGPRGPTLLEDFHFREKIFHFDHERIPERVVHARGYGAHGFFENYKPLLKYTRADLFQRAGERTPAFVRFSTVAGNKGSADLARDVRGFAVKLYTQEGNWGHRRQQHPGLLHSGRDKVSGFNPRGETGARPRVSPSPNRA
jgi:catalase